MSLIPAVWRGEQRISVPNSSFRSVQTVILGFSNKSISKVKAHTKIIEEDLFLISGLLVLTYTWPHKQIDTNSEKAETAKFQSSIGCKSASHLQMQVSGLYTEVSVKLIKLNWMLNLTTKYIYLPLKIFIMFISRSHLIRDSCRYSYFHSWVFMINIYFPFSLKHISF